jgi:beta-glucosidase
MDFSAAQWPRQHARANRFPRPPFAHAALAIPLACALMLAGAASGAETDPAGAVPAFKDKSLSPEARAKDMVARMTLLEKAEQMQDSAPAIERLGLKYYGWWNEVLHGVARAGNATVFPQAIGLAASWDTALMERIGDTIALEGRANYNAALKRDPKGTGRYFGINYWTPNINIFRDPRWGGARKPTAKIPC